MNIYYIINGRLPTEKANGYQISQMCQAFEENGASVQLLRPRRQLNPKHLPFKDNLKEFYNLKKTLTVVNVWSFDFQAFFHRLAPFLDRFQFFSNLLHAFSFILGLVFYLNRRRKSIDDVLYLRDVNLLSWLFPFLDRELKKKIILELHYLPGTAKKKNRYVRILGKARAVICITNKMKDDLVKLGYPPEKVWVEHDGVDLENFQISLTQEECRGLFDYPKDQTIVGYVGNFHTNGLEKGVDDLIKATPLILAEQPQVHFYFVGGPMDRVPKYRKIIDDLKLPADHFHFFDRRPVSEVPASMAACDILVIPLPWNEYFAYYMSPMKLFEYMASGRCIVATNVESLCEVLRHNGNALIAQHSDLQDLAQKILNAVKNPELRNSLGRQAQNDVQYYVWRRRAERILRFIQ